MNENFVSIELVGACNDNILCQVYLGKLFFKDGVLMLTYANEETPVKIKHFNKKRGGGMIEIPSWCNGEGLIILYIEPEKIRFTTGTNSAYQSGSSGLLINGGIEMISVLKQLNLD